ncbi:hypothetical protein CHRYSEOSP005_04270 [Chryseobacterium sp. Alg-005]|uniref:cell wall anchor protein n=1 Tax=Chryseobacterium sp. Alg-005 TaxID=3159516 RepID=UPI003555BCCF
MKKILLVAGILLSHCVFAQTADKLIILDTRDTNALPSTYNHEVKAEFKFRDILGAPGTGMYSGLLTIAPWQDNSGNKHHQLNFNDGGIFYRNAFHADTQWGNWSRLVMESHEGNVRVGLNDNTTSSATFRVYKNENTLMEIANSSGVFQIAKASCANCGAVGAVPGDTVLRNLGTTHNIIISMPNDNNDGSTYIGFNDVLHGTWIKFLNNAVAKFDGKIYAKEVEVKANVWADYVFKKDYKLASLEEVEKHIEEKGHLPNIPSAEEVTKKGINVAEMDSKLLEKIEELTLYSIEQSKRLKQQSEKIEKLEKQLEKLLSNQK